MKIVRRVTGLDHLPGDDGGVHLGIADHLGWAVAVVSSPSWEVLDRRRLELVEPGLAAAPIHYDRGRSSDALLADLVAQVRTSITRLAGAARSVLGSRAAEVLDGPRAVLGPPWTKDHRVALAARR